MDREAVTFWEKLRSPQRISAKLKEVGVLGMPAWLGGRVRAKFSNWLYERRARKHCQELHRIDTTASPDVLHAFYDLQASPETFDFACFLIAAERKRHALACTQIQIVFVPKPVVGARSCELYSRDQHEWRLWNLMMPACSLLPTRPRILVCGSREEATTIQQHATTHVFPDSYSVAYPKCEARWPYREHPLQPDEPLPGLQASPAAIAHVQKWIQEQGVSKRRIVTVTLREASHYAERNADLAEWMGFLADLDETFFPVIIRDIEQAFSPLPEEDAHFACFDAAPWNMDLRMAMYQLSFICMCANNGPDILCQLSGNNTRFLIFREVDERNPYCTESFLYEYYGVRRGEQPNPFTPFQRFTWSDDKREILTREFVAMTRTITEKLGPDYLPHLPDA